jgi:hypothetical protein
MMYDEAEGIHKEIRTLTIQKQNYKDQYDQALASADAERKAVQDQIKQQDEQKRKTFEKKYEISKDQYNKKRSLFEKQIDRVWDREDKEVMR